MSWQPCEGAALPLPAKSGEVKVRSVVFLLFPLVPSSRSKEAVVEQTLRVIVQVWAGDSVL